VGLGSANAIAQLPLIPGVTELAILADRDHSGAGLAAARICANRWSHARCKTTLLVPHRDGTDFNDLIKESAS
jgi:putative DNA primase/helicase